MTGPTQAPAFASLPWRELLMDPRLVDRPLEEQGAYYRIVLAAWGAGGRLPADPRRVAMRSSIPLAPLSNLTVERLTALLDELAPVGADGQRSLGEAFEGWVRRAVEGAQATAASTAKAREAKARKAAERAVRLAAEQGGVAGVEDNAGTVTAAETATATGSVTETVAEPAAGSVPPPSPSPAPAGSVSDETGPGAREGQDREEQEPPSDPITDGQLIALERSTLWLPDCKAPADWSEGRSISVYRALRKRGVPGSRIQLALEGLAVLRRTGEVSWLRVGEKTTIRAVYDGHSGSLNMFELAEQAAVREADRPGRKRTPATLGKIMAGVTAQERPRQRLPDAIPATTGPQLVAQQDGARAS